MLSSLAIAWLNQAYLNFNFRLKNYFPFKQAVILGFILSQILLIIIYLFSGLVLVKFDLINSFIISVGLFFYLFIRTVHQSNFEKKKVIKLEILKSILYFALPISIYFIFAIKDYQVIVLAFFLSNFASLFFLKPRLNVYFPIRLNSKSKKILLRMLYFGIPIGFWLALMQGINFFDRYIILNRLGEFELGIYTSISDLFTKFFSFSIFPVTLALHPIFVKYWTSERNEVLKSMKKIISLACLGLLLLLSIVYLLENMLIFHLLDQHLNSTLFIYFIAAAQFFLQLALISQKPLELGSKSLSMLLLLLLCFLIHFILVTIFIEEYKLLAVAASLFIISVLYNILCFSFTKRFM